MQTRAAAELAPLHTLTVASPRPSKVEFLSRLFFEGRRYA